MIEARWWEPGERQSVRCGLCPHGCVILPGGEGRCRARINREGVLYAATYGRTVTVNVDPIEKKPLYHVMPGEAILSLGHNSCNLACRFCQNHTISQTPAPDFEIPPDQLPSLCREHDVGMVAFTYTEPLTGLEYVIDAGRHLKAAGVKVILVTNGYVNSEPFVEALEVIDALNIDLKGFTCRFYGELCSGTLEPVMDSIRAAVGRCHVEVTTLVIPGENDGEDELRALTGFLADLDPELPFHLSRYFPQYRMQTPPTPPETLLRAAEIARERLRHVYIGNLSVPGGADTRCPACEIPVIRRSGYRTDITALDNGRCTGCGYALKGIWNG